MDSEWSISKNKSHKKSKFIKNLQTEPRLKFNYNECEQRISETIKQIKNTSNFHKLLVYFEERCLKFDEIFLYGVGSIFESDISIIQLSLSIALHLHFNKPKSYCLDPVLSDNEYKLIEFYGFNRTTSNNKGFHVVNGSTLFLMFHCPTQMFNNLLWSNWSIKKLRKMTIIGNSFSYYRNKIYNQSSECSYLDLISEYTSESDVSELWTDDYRVFENISTHLFIDSKLKEIPKDMWLKSKKPTYKLLNEMLN